jgi:hypothetical protein
MLNSDIMTLLVLAGIIILGKLAIKGLQILAEEKSR